MIKLGITGGIGCGKSTVCKIFTAMRVPVYVSDIRATMLMLTDINLKSRLIAKFGDNFYDEFGYINKDYVSSLVFNSIETRNQLNAIVHPAVADDFVAWTMSHQNYAYVVQESAVLFESGHDKYVDFKVNVYCSKEEKIKRLQRRDNSSIEMIEKKIAAQIPDEEKNFRSDYVISNNNNDLIIDQALKIHEDILYKNNRN